MKSERQFERSALCWADVTCAAAPRVSAAKAASAVHGNKVRRKCCVVRLMKSPIGVPDGNIIRILSAAKI
jgi:hypothetical protein